MASLAKLHEQALSKYKSVAGRLERHKAVIGTTTDRVVATLETAAGGAAAAAIDHYMGGGGELPEAMVGPVPVVLASALACTVASIAFQRDSFSKDLANFGNGLAAAGSYAEGLRFLKSMPATAAASSAPVT